MPSGDGCFNDCIVHYNESWLSPSHARDAFDIDWGSRNNVVALNYGHASKGYCVAILGASCTTTLALAHGRGVWPAEQFPPYAEDFFVYTWDGEKTKNFTIDHNLSCFRGSDESGVVCAWWRDFGMRVDDGHRFLDNVLIQLSHC